MAYGDITPESLLSLTSSSQLTTQQTSTSESTTPQPNTGTQTPSLLQLDPSDETSLQQLNPKAVQHMHEVAKVWSRPSSSHSAPGDRRWTNSVSDVPQRLKSGTTVSPSTMLTSCAKWSYICVIVLSLEKSNRALLCAQVGLGNYMYIGNPYSLSEFMSGGGGTSTCDCYSAHCRIYGNL